MVQKFTGPKKELKPFPSFVHGLATSSAAKWRDLRAALRQESTPAPGAKRVASATFQAALDDKFPSLKGCATDIVCLRQLFEGYVRLHKPPEKTMKKVMRAINKILPLQYVTDSQMSSYSGQVGKYRAIVKRHYGGVFFRATRRLLQFAGGSESALEAMQYKVERDEAASEALSKRQRHKIPVTEASIVKAARKWGKMETPVEAFLFAQLMTGSRKSECMLPTVANYTRETSEVQGFLVQWGTAKEKGVTPDYVLSDEDEDEDEDEIDVWANRRRVEKPILRIIKDPKVSPLDLFEVSDVQRALVVARDGLDVQELLDDGKTPQQVTHKWDRALQNEIVAEFHDANEFAKVWRTNRLSTHFLRKVYAVEKGGGREGRRKEMVETEDVCGGGGRR